MSEDAISKLFVQFDDGDGVLEYGECVIFYSFLKSA